MSCRLGIRKNIQTFLAFPDHRVVLTSVLQAGAWALLQEGAEQTLAAAAVAAAGALAGPTPCRRRAKEKGVGGGVHARLPCMAGS